MQIGDLPVLREAMEKFAEAGAELIPLMQQYADYNTLPVGDVTVYHIQQAVRRAQEELENVNR